MEPIDIARNCFRDWASRDLDAKMSWLHDDVRYTLHVSEGSMPLAGESRGKTEVRRQLQLLLETFEFLAFVVDTIKETGEPGEVRLSVLFYYRHRATGQQLDGRSRLLMRVEHGLVTSIDEYHDRLALEAFMKLVALEEYAEGPA